MHYSEEENEKVAQIPVFIPKEVAIKALNRHIEILESKLLFLTDSYFEAGTGIFYEYEQKISITKQEIYEAMEQRRILNVVMQMNILDIRYFNQPRRRTSAAKFQR